jgi:hypothetical protein
MPQWFWAKRSRRRYRAWWAAATSATLPGSQLLGHLAVRIGRHPIHVEGRRSEPRPGSYCLLTRARTPYIAVPSGRHFGHSMMGMGTTVQAYASKSQCRKHTSRLPLLAKHSWFVANYATRAARWQAWRLGWRCTRVEVRATRGTRADARPLAGPASVSEPALQSGESARGSRETRGSPQ